MSLKLRRQLNGHSQEDFAKRLGVSKNLISMWETGKQNPPPKYWSQLARMYGIPFDDFARQMQERGAIR